MIDAQHGPGPSGDQARSRPSDGTRRRGAKGASSTFDESGLLALADRIDRKPKGHAHGRKKSPKPRRFRKTKWALGAVAVLLVVVVGGGAGYAWYLNHEIHRIDVKGLVDSPTTGADAGTENILMVGSTDRCALTVQNAAYGLCSQGVNGVNSDVVMILHLDPTTHTVSDPLHPPGPVRPQRPDHRGQQDRRRPLRGPEPAGGGHQRGLRHPHPALRRPQLRHLRQRRQRRSAG